MNKLLTIVIPVYNTDPDKLERCLKSIPDNDNIFVSIYDDCSNKYNAEKEVSKIINNNSLDYLYKDGNKFVRFNENKGLGFVRNQSIKDLHKDSRYILFLDSDDEVNITREILLDIEINYYIAKFYGIELLSNESSFLENNRKYLDQKMIPYFITPAIYNTSYLYNNNIFFDESRRIFEDIQFSVKLWSNLIKLNGENSIDISNDVIYKYYLEGESLTRNNKTEKMIDDLYYWIDWIKEFYNNSSSKNILKPYLFNRIRYESIKILSMKMSLNGDLDKYRDLMNNIKPYNIDKVFNS